MSSVILPDQNPLDNIRVVLVRTFHPGNIGSTARAMKTMGLSDLCLVNPVDFPSNEATKMAVSADDVVNNSQQFDSIYDAVKDCTVVIASTARSRGYDLPVLSPEQSAEMLYFAAKKSKQKVALLFGPERMGLSNEDLQFAKYRVTIPTNPDYSSLNLAAAVQTLSYELIKQHTLNSEPDELEITRELPNSESLELFYTHMEQTLVDSGFIFKKHPGEVMQKLRTLFTRAQPDKTELNILRGMLASFQQEQK
ncbi:MAG: TrmJ/YjtD family RNA methyltransferase [Cocleimonas sp.]